MQFVIDPNDKFYPNADNWMWDYCTFLGKFTDSKGINYDLGVHISLNGGIVLNATVYSNEEGQYNSANFWNIEDEDREFILETYKRAKFLNIIR